MQLDIPRPVPQTRHSGHWSFRNPYIITERIGFTASGIFEAVRFCKATVESQGFDTSGASVLLANQALGWEVDKDQVIRGKESEPISLNPGLLKRLSAPQRRPNSPTFSPGFVARAAKGR